MTFWLLKWLDFIEIHMKRTGMVQKVTKIEIWVTFEVAQKSWNLAKVNKSFLELPTEQMGPNWTEVDLRGQSTLFEGRNFVCWTWGPKLPTVSFWDSWKKIEKFVSNESNDMKSGKTDENWHFLVFLRPNLTWKVVGFLLGNGQTQPWNALRA